MKRLVAVLAAAAVMVSCIGCGSKKEKVDLPSEAGTEGKTVEVSETSEVEITMENWQEYFEIRQSVSPVTNDFDEIESAYIGYALYLKDEFEGKVFDADIDIGYTKSNPRVCTVEYHADTQELIMGEPFTESEMQSKGYYLDWLESVLEETSHVSMWIANHEVELGSFEGAWEDSNVVEGNVLKFDSCVYQYIEVTRIRGTLILFN